jgi:hypothetical protein
MHPDCVGVDTEVAPYTNLLESGWTTSAIRREQSVHRCATAAIRKPGLGRQPYFVILIASDPAGQDPRCSAAIALDDLVGAGGCPNHVR